MRVLVVSADRTGASGHPQNRGDALLTDALVSALRSDGTDARALDLGEADRRRGAPRLRARGMRDLSATIGAADGVVLGGGTLFADDQPDAAFAGLPRLCAATAGMTRIHNTSFAAFGVGVEPIARRRARAAVRFAARRGPVWVRDDASAARLTDLAGTTPRVAADVALLGADEIAAHARDDREGVVLALNRTEAARLEPWDVDALAAAYGPVRFVSMDQGRHADDAAIPDAVRRRLLDVADCAGPWQDAADAIGAASVVVASRMHAMYLAAMIDTPMAVMTPTAKTRAFAAEFGVPVVQRPADAVGGVGTADPGALTFAIERARSALDEVTSWLGR